MTRRTVGPKQPILPKPGELVPLLAIWAGFVATGSAVYSIGLFSSFQVQIGRIPWDVADFTHDALSWVTGSSLTLLFTWPAMFLIDATGWLQRLQGKKAGKAAVEQEDRLQGIAFLFLILAATLIALAMPYVGLALPSFRRPGPYWNFLQCAGFAGVIFSIGNIYAWARRRAETSSRIIPLSFGFAVFICFEFAVFAGAKTYAASEFERPGRDIVTLADGTPVATNIVCTRQKGIFVLQSNQLVFIPWEGTKGITYGGWTEKAAAMPTAVAVGKVVAPNFPATLSAK